MSGLPALPIAAMRSPFKPTSALTIPVVEDQRVGDDVDRTLLLVTWLWPMPSRICRRQFHLLTVAGEILLHSTMISVSASRTRSPVVGPNMSA